MSNYTEKDLKGKSVAELKEICAELKIELPQKALKGDLVNLILNAPKTEEKKEEVKKEEPKKEITPVEKKKGGFIVPKKADGFKPIQIGEKEPKKEPPVEGKKEEEIIRQGFLEINQNDGYGFIRATYDGTSDKDAYVHQSKIKMYQLRKGDYLVAKCKVLQEGKSVSVSEIISINGEDPAKLGKRPQFDELIPIYPDERLRLEIPTKPKEFAIRLIDLISPIGKGQRGIIVSPPKAGKTTLLKLIANSISFNYPDAKLFVLLIDERPEEVTDMQRSINGEVVYSTFDEVAEHHIKVAEVLLERAKRLVESGKDVVILLDSITRLARAYNTNTPTSGKTLSGGVDPTALHYPKRFFGSARNIENGGSLTIIATALIETGSRMDEVIFEEFKGTGNMEIHLDRKLSERRIFPAIDISKSGTRKEELLMSPNELAVVWGIRKMLSANDTAESTEWLINQITKTNTNKDLIDILQKNFSLYEKEGFTFRKPNNIM
ncbi:MAG: transcription termination factor Rho [Clostridia bacterium]|nr:transcription termination factor Rho [Clostridia bacterium]